MLTPALIAISLLFNVFCPFSCADMVQGARQEPSFFEIFRARLNDDISIGMEYLIPVQVAVGDAPFPILRPDLKERMDDYQNIVNQVDPAMPRFAYVTIVVFLPNSDQGKAGYYLILEDLYSETTARKMADVLRDPEIAFTITRMNIKWDATANRFKSSDEQDYPYYSMDRNFMEGPALSIGYLKSSDILITPVRQAPPRFRIAKLSPKSARYYRQWEDEQNPGKYLPVGKVPQRKGTRLSDYVR